MTPSPASAEGQQSSSGEPSNVVSALTDSGSTILGADCASVANCSDSSSTVEMLDVLDPESGQPVGEPKPRSTVHRLGLWHRVVHVWFVTDNGELVLQRRVPWKESHPNLWDISAAGHIDAGETSRATAQRESFEELGVRVPPDAFELLFTIKQSSVLNNNTYFNNEFCDVYLVHTENIHVQPAGGTGPWTKNSFVVQASEVADVKLMPWRDVRRCYVEQDPTFVAADVVSSDYRKLFEVLEERFP